MTSSIKGKKILITRGKSQGKEFASQIMELGGIPIEIPLITFQHTRNQAVIETIMTTIPSFDWIVFTSSNAVRFFFSISNKLELPNMPKIAVVGAKTANAVRRLGYEPALVPTSYIAEHLLTALMTKLKKGERILLARGNLAKPLLFDELKKLGFFVEDLVIYETAEEHSERERLIHLLESREIDVITFTSPSTVNSFIMLIDGTNWREWLRSVTIACIGPVTEHAAINAKLHVHICPKQYTIHDMINAMEAYFNRELKEEK